MGWPILILRVIAQHLSILQYNPLLHMSDNGLTCYAKLLSLNLHKPLPPLYFGSWSFCPTSGILPCRWNGRSYPISFNCLSGYGMKKIRRVIRVKHSLLQSYFCCPDILAKRPICRYLWYTVFNGGVVPSQLYLFKRCYKIGHQVVFY